MPHTRTIAIAGASGFVGRYLTDRLSQRVQVIGLSRVGRPPRAGVTWRRCDLFSLLQVEQALEGADTAIYLAHSMLPSARLTQGHFQDMDLILADNFARAAASAGIKRIIYLGGIVPPDGRLSAHLKSRVEVEKVLGATDVPVTTLRAGLIIGAGGTSFGLLQRLIERAPVLPAPPWTLNRCQPIAIDDVVSIIQECIDAPWTEGETYNIGGPDVCTYRELMKKTAEAMGKRRVVAPLPVSPSTRLSTWTVNLLTGDPRELVGPLMDSLRHSMLAPERKLQDRLGIPGVTLTEMLRRANETDPYPNALPSTAVDRFRNTVRSVQRMPLPEGRDAQWAAEEYMRWLPRALGMLLRADVNGQVCHFRIIMMRRPLLELTYSPSRSTSDRTLFYVTGGLLANARNRRGRLEFRRVLDAQTMIAAIHDFVPKLPWFVYTITQAIAHIWVMWRFGRHLGRQASARMTARSVQQEVS